MSRFQAQEPLITVSGEASCMVKPDLAVITLIVRGEHKTSQRNAETLQAAKAKSALGLLNRLGVEDRNVNTLSYTLGPEYDRVATEKKLRLFHATQVLAVRVNIEDSGMIIDNISHYAEVQSITFEVSDRKKIQEDLVDTAIENAKERAEHLADRLSINLGAIVGFSESGNSRGGGGSYAMAAMAESVPKIHVGESELTVSVSVTYRIVVP